MTENTLQRATLANGCFWCTEAIFKRIKGVQSVQSGFTGGHTENPTYEKVSMGTTGHAESLQITFDPNIVSYETLLKIFWATHDPTTLNQQGYDIGTEYRSAIFYHDDAQKKTAENLKIELDKTSNFGKPIVTEIVPFTKFYPASADNNNFYESGKRPDYCRIIIDPKINKLLKEYSKEVKEEYKEL